MFYVRQQSGEVAQINLATATMGALTLPKAFAIASDAKGALGALVASEENEGLLNLRILPAGETAWDVYGMDFAEHPDDDPEVGRLHLALFGPAAAIGADGYGAELSWEPEEEGWRELHLPPAVFHGPVAVRSDKEIFAAYNIEGQVNVRRHVRGQEVVTRIARYGLDDQWEGTEATVTSIAWDEERRTLWAASPGARPDGIDRAQDEPGIVRAWPRRSPPSRRAPRTPGKGASCSTAIQRVVSVSGPGGLVLGGGEHLYMLRPGAQRWMRRDPMTELGRVLAVAAEPRNPWRYAVSSEKGLTVYGLPKDQKLTLTAPGDNDPPATHLAWGTLEKDRVLYLRWDDGNVGRLRLDLGQVEPLEMMPMDALAADANGTIAIVSLHADAPHSLFTQDGVRFEERPATAGPPELARRPRPPGRRRHGHRLRRRGLGRLPQPRHRRRLPPRGGPRARRSGRLPGLQRPGSPLRRDLDQGGRRHPARRRQGRGAAHRRDLRHGRRRPPHHLAHLGRLPQRPLVLLAGRRHPPQRGAHREGREEEAAELSGPQRRARLRSHPRPTRSGTSSVMASAKSGCLAERARRGGPRARSG